MPELRSIELFITGAAAVATILATYFAYRAVRESRDTVTLARETVEIGKNTLAIEKQNLASLQETALLSEHSLELARENLSTARREQTLMERDHLTGRLATAASAVVQMYVAATHIQSSVVTAGVELAAARARLRAALVGLPQDLKEARALVHQGGDPAGVGIILRTWTNAMTEIEDAITGLTESDATTAS